VPDFEHLDYYQLLGISRSATLEDIRRAYRREISKYHPDRYVNASPDEQTYAERRSQRITEAYSALNQLASRGAAGRGTAARQTPPQPRDYPAELYAQAKEHLAAGRNLQAIAVLRQLQQLNPFYRDSADLLAQTEAAANIRQPQGKRRGVVPLLIAGAVVGLAVVAVATWMFTQRGIGPATAGVAPSSTSVVAIVASVPAATATPKPLPTVTPTLPPPTPEPTLAPTPPPPPTAILAPTPPPPPTATPTPAPQQETGAVLSADAFDRSGWATLAARGWSVGFQEERYRITANPGVGPIWSYRTGAGDVSVGVDVQARGGEGGLLLRFGDAQNYLSVSINPQQTSFRLEQRSRGLTNVLAGGQNPAINAGADAQNRLVARLNGKNVVVLVNGQMLAEVDVPTAPNSERYGLIAIGTDTAADVLFDNLEIRTLE
jgi:hypothetical protein